jgi:hypothetical protein
LSSRVSFIRRYAYREGISEESLAAIWQAKKHGYNKAQDAPFEQFAQYFRTIGDDAGRFSPRSITAGHLVGFLRERHKNGASHATIKEASSSISMACFEATDGAVHLGKKHSVKSFLQSVRIRAPVGPKKKRAEQYHDVAVMIQEAWQYGPNAALGLGFLKEKLIILLMVDCAARPSDLGCIYRILEGRHAMIRFEGNDMYDGLVRQVSITGQKLRVRFDDTEVSWQDRVDITELLPPVEDTTVDDAHASTFTNNS